MPHSSVGYLHAWALWANGDPNLKEMSLWGLSILWWGRAGKFAAFAAGLVLVLDIIGPDRLRRFNTSLLSGLRADKRSGILGGLVIGALYLLIQWIAPFSGSFLWEVVGIVALAGLGLALGVLAALGKRALIWVFERDKIAQVARVISLALFAVGFHFDMLAS